MSTLQEPTINPAGDGKVDPHTVTITGRKSVEEFLS